VQRVFAAFLVAQAVVGLAWWTALVVSPTARSWFELWPERPEMLDSLLLADLLVIVAGSLVGAWGIERETRWAVPVVAFVAGGLLYVTLYLMAWVALTGVGALCFVIMVPPTTLTCWVAVHLWRARASGPAAVDHRDAG
jgi:hypothetical protein